MELWKLKQNVSEFVGERHQIKNGTPTLGGLIFIVPTLITLLLLYLRGSISISHNLIIVVIVFIAYALLGFADDFLKIKYHNNKGLSIMLKLLIQMLIALAFFYIYMRNGGAPTLEISSLGLDVNLVEDQEPDAALGNGGLGRLAACFLDSLATLGYAAYGCGIRYRYGMFKQEIRDGFQVEVPDNWLKHGNPFEIKRAEYAVEVKFGGYVKLVRDEVTGRDKFVQEGCNSVLAVPYDLPVVGYGNNIVNTLRIWDAEAVECFQLDSFDKGDYQKAVEQENLARNIVEVLYPNDNHYAGKELRLKQQYFFVSASIQEAVDKYMRKHDDIRKFHEKVTFQLNDTHPTVAEPELMRILLDEYYLTWDEAWEVTTKTCAYTNHTIMAEALEKWPIELFSRLLPRIYQIVEEINRRFIIFVNYKI